MSTTSGPMGSFKVTDPQGNVYIMTPIDSTARTAAATALSTATTLNKDSVKYKNLVNDPNITEYDPEAAYAVGDYCYKDNELYQCNTAIVSPGETWNATHWDKIIINDLIEEAQSTADGAVDAIENAKSLVFNEDYFNVTETQDEVQASMNGVPFGIDDETPLQILQDTAEGLVLGSDAPFAQAVATKFSTSSTYAVDAIVIHKGKLYRCTTAVSVAGAWNAANWTEVDVVSLIGAISLPNEAAESDIDDLFVEQQQVEPGE